MDIWNLALMKYIISGLVAFTLTVVLTPLVIRLAKACKCLDVPGARRLHKKVTPRWGGLAFFAGVLPVMIFANAGYSLAAYIVAAVLLIGVGIVDDRRALGWKVKFAWMAVAATIVIFGGDITIHYLGTYGFLGRVDLGWLSIPFTYLCIIGVTNAINLLDGLDGLAGGVALLGFLFMGIAAALAGNVPIAVACFAFVGALGGFLLYNFPNARVFMGDSGSTFLGFSLSCMAVILTQHENPAVDVMFPVLLLLLPIFDTLRVLVVRLLDGKNPFLADNNHLHYLIIRNNVSSAGAVLLFWLLTSVFGCTALVMSGKSSSLYLVVVLNAVLLLGMFASSLSNRRREASPEARGASRQGPVIIRGE